MKNKYSIILIIITLFFNLYCADNKDKEVLKNQTDERLMLIGKYSLSIPEPSGLALDADSNFLWTVSDENSLMYKLTLDGKIIDSIRIEGKDLEGIAILDNNSVCVITERDRGLLFLSKDGKLKKRLLMDISMEENAGIEGITLNKSNNHIFLLNEKNPRLLLELDEDYSILNRYKLDFAKDLSGMDYVAELNELWLISDESQLLVRCNMKGEVIDRFKIDIPQIEGIAVNYSKKLIYIVSDNTEQLYVFELKENKPD